MVLEVQFIVPDGDARQILRFKPIKVVSCSFVGNRRIQVHSFEAIDPVQHFVGGSTPVVPDTEENHHSLKTGICLILPEPVNNLIWV